MCISKTVASSNLEYVSACSGYVVAYLTRQALPRPSSTIVFRQCAFYGKHYARRSNTMCHLPISSCSSCAYLRRWQADRFWVNPKSHILYTGAGTSNMLRRAAFLIGDSPNKIPQYLVVLYRGGQNAPAPCISPRRSGLAIFHWKSLLTT